MANSSEPQDPAKLRREALRYEALLGAEGTIVWVIDAQLRPTGDNPAWERYTGQTGDAYLEHGWLDALHPDDRAQVGRAAATAVASGEPLSLELRIRRHDGEFRRHLIRAVPVRYPQHPAQLPGHRLVTLLQFMHVFLKDFEEGLYPSYRDLTTIHYIETNKP